MDTTRPLAMVLWTTRATRQSLGSRSPVYLAAPVTLSAASTRILGIPISIWGTPFQRNDAWPGPPQRTGPVAAVR